MGDAEYSYATLYKFDPAARTHVITRVQNRINQAAVQCWYNVDHDTFELTCPSAIGPAADDVLGETVSTYIEEELRLLERDENERLPRIVRFPDSALLDADGDADDRIEELAQAQQAADEPRHASHVVTTGHAGQSLVRLLRLEQLPGALVKRILGAEADRASTKAMTKGTTARVVRWDDDKQDYISNGRTGLPIPRASSEDEEALLSLAPFSHLQSHHKEMNTSIGRADQQTKHWRFASGYEPTVGQWLQGMGEMVSDDQEPPEVPKDARKLLVAEQHHAFGRPRLPKGSPILPKDSDSEGDYEDNAPSTVRADFKQLLRGRPMAVSSEKSDTESEKSDDEQPERSALGVRSFSSMLKKKEDKFDENKDPQLLVRKPITTSPARSLPSLEPAHASASSASARSIVTPPEANSRSGQPALQPLSGALQSYGRPFAAVDKIGLTADAVSQARWELDHVSTQTTPRKKPGSISVRSSRPPTLMPMEASVRASIDPRRDVQRSHQRQNSSSADSYQSRQETVRSQLELQACDKVSWTKKFVHKYHPPADLIDASVPVATTPTIKPPPGLTFSPSNMARLQQSDAGLVTPQAQCFVSNTQADGSLNGNLIDVDVDDRLQVQPALPFEKHFTMRQQAKKKGRSLGNAKGKTGINAVELEKPDPPPAPPSKKQAKVQAGLSKTLTSSTSGVMMSDAELPKHLTRGGNGEETESVAAQEPLEQLLQDARQEECAQIVVKIGTILSQVLDDKDLRRATMTAEQLQQRLNSAAAAGAQTTFLERITTSTSDAIHVLNMRPGTVADCTSVYVLQLRDPDRRPFNVEFASNLPACIPNAYYTDSNDSTVYLHYPIHVWDARCTTSSPRTRANATVPLDYFLPLVSSMQTDGHPPSSQLCSGSMTPEKILAKRVCRRPWAPAVSLVVTQIHDLRLQFDDAPNGANLRATCLDGQIMVEQHRMWWEVELVFGVHLIKDAVALKAEVDSFVSHMDGVGFENKGPWVKEEEEAAAAKLFPEPMLPFW